MHLYLFLRLGRGKVGCLVAKRCWFLTCLASIGVRTLASLSAWSSSQSSSTDNAPLTRMHVWTLGIVRWH